MPSNAVSTVARPLSWYEIGERQLLTTACGNTSAMDDIGPEHESGLFPLAGRPPILPSEERDRIAERFPPAPPADERSLAGRIARLKR